MIDDIRDAQEIAADKRYTFSEACRYLHGQSGGRLSVRQLHRRRAEGRVAAHLYGKTWVIWGKDLLQMIKADGGYVPRSATMRRRDTKRAIEELRALGVDV